MLVLALHLTQNSASDDVYIYSQAQSVGRLWPNFPQKPNILCSRGPFRGRKIFFLL